MRLADAFKPGIDAPVMPNYRMIRRRLKLIGVEVLHDPALPPCADALLACLTSCEDLDVHHIVLLFSHFWIIVDATVEYEVAWLHLFLLELYRQAVELISLIPSIQLKSEFFSQVIDDLFDQRTAVQVQWSPIMLLAFFPIPSPPNWASTVERPNNTNHEFTNKATNPPTNPTNRPSAHRQQGNPDPSD